MPVVQIPPVVLLAPAFLIGAYLGFRRGWQREIITAGGLIVAILLLRRGLEDFLWLINLVADRLARVVAVLVGTDMGSPAPPIAVDGEWEQVVTLTLLALMVALAYLLGNWLGRHARLDRTSRLFGSIVAGLNFTVITSRVLAILRPSSPAPATADAFSVRIPSFAGANIVVPPPPEQALLITWPVAALVFLVVSTLVYLLLRMARA